MFRWKPTNYLIQLPTQYRKISHHKAIRKSPILLTQNVCVRTHCPAVVVGVNSPGSSLLKVLSVTLVSASLQHRMGLISLPPLVSQIFAHADYFSLLDLFYASVFTFLPLAGILLVACPRCFHQKEFMHEHLP